MASTIKLKNGSGAPLAGDLVQGEPALDLTNKRLYTEDAGGTVIEIGTNPSTIDINAGTIDGTVIGGTTAAAGSFTNITVSGTVDGRDVAADGTKLDGIEALADVTDTANVTAAGALMDSELTNITAIKALDQGVATTDSPSFAGATLTTADINGGTIDGATIGGASAGAGSFTTLTASDDVNFDSGTLFVDASANAVGIGTLSPSGKLDVENASNIQFTNLTSTAAGAASILSILGGSGSEQAICYNETALRFGSVTGKNAAGFAERMRIDSSGTLSLNHNLREAIYNLTGTAIDPVNGGIQYKTLSANTTFTESLADGDSVILRISGGATYTVTWPTMTWITSAGNAAPTLGGSDVVVLWQESSTVYGAYVGSYA